MIKKLISWIKSFFKMAKVPKYFRGKNEFIN